MVTVVGGGVAGISAACALADAGYPVRLVERRSYLGGRATSYVHPGVRETIDNCQHVLFGCCTNLLAFYRRIGVEDRIRWSEIMTFVEPGGRRSALGPSGLMAPLHGLPRLLSAAAFSAADKLALARAFRALLRPVPADSREPLGSWLRRHGQTPGAMERFWRLVIASALNADLDAIALPYAAKVIRELFLNSAAAGRMGVSAVPLAELYAPAADYLRRRGGEVVCNARIESGAWDPAGRRWTLTGPNGSFESEQVVLALPFEGLARLLPGLPERAGTAALSAQVARHEHWPICSVHLWFDRQICDVDHAVLLDGELHWLFNKSRIQNRSGPGSYVELVVSASRSFAARGGDSVIPEAAAALGGYFPAARSARLEKAAFVKEVHATFGVPPGIDEARPGPASPWPHCWLAGDWTATGWPSTMESAARSGHLAAEALCEAEGRPSRFLAPDLPPSGFMRLLTPASRPA